MLMHGDREISLYHLYTAQQGTHPFMHPPFARLQGIYSQSGLDCTHTYGALLLFPVTEITIMSQSASSILPMLGRRKSYVSQHGLESVLTDLKACGLLADDVTSSRSSIKRAREEDLASHTSCLWALGAEDGGPGGGPVQQDGRGAIHPLSCLPEARLQLCSVVGFSATRGVATQGDTML